MMISIISHFVGQAERAERWRREPQKVLSISDCDAMVGGLTGAGEDREEQGVEEEEERGGRAPGSGRGREQGGGGRRRRRREK